MFVRWLLGELAEKTREINNSARHETASDTVFKWLAGKRVSNQKVQDWTM